MKKTELENALKKMIEEDAKHPPEGRLYPLYEAGVIDAQGRVFSESLAIIEDLLRDKGFGGVSAFHMGGIPGGFVRLHEKVAKGREAEGPYDEIRKIIENARDPEDLWAELEKISYRQPPVSGKKKTG